MPTTLVKLRAFGIFGEKEEEYNVGKKQAKQMHANKQTNKLESNPSKHSGKCH
jgi:hypothetical protein